MRGLCAWFMCLVCVPGLRIPEYTMPCFNALFKYTNVHINMLWLYWYVAI